MNEEQTKRLADAAEAVLQAEEALEEARDAIQDRRFESDQDRERMQAAQQLAGKLETAGRRIHEALRKSATAAAATERDAAYRRYRSGVLAAREGRALARGATGADGSSATRERATQALADLESALSTAAGLVFGE